MKNNIVLKDNYAIIHINSQKHGNFEVLIDLEDVDKIDNYKWHISHCTDNYFRVQATFRQKGIKKHLKLHHLIIGKPPKGIVTDHIDGSTLNNRKENLRFCSMSQNQKNSKGKNLKRYKGVFFHKKANKWMANIRSDNKSNYIGLFNSQIEAAYAYDQKAKELHGEFANLNFKGVEHCG